jgi:hypothetical protein
MSSSDINSTDKLTVRLHSLSWPFNNLIFSIDFECTTVVPFFSMEFPKPPPLKSNSDLMTRIGKFLPEIEAANEELLLTKENDVRIDVGLVPDNDDDDTDDDDDDDDDEEQGDESSEPTIQLKVQLADVDQNKTVFDLLAAHDELDEQKTDATTEEEEQPEVSAKEEALVKLMSKEKKLAKSSKTLIQEIK